jgi:dienelactone hydrolase
MESAMRLCFVTLVLAVTVSAHCAVRAETSCDPAEPIEIVKARNFIDRLVDEDYDGAVKDFDENMRKSLPPNRLKVSWQEKINKHGKLQQQGAPRTEKRDKGMNILILCEFENANMDFRMVFSRAGLMTGLFILPAYKSPDYVKSKAFRDVEVSVGNGEWALPGTLSVPVGDGPFPAIILVHGSGPNDRDGTIGPNKPYRDLAGGLASRGIAVLRYDKRTFVYADKLPMNHTVREEVIDDALAAAELLRGRREIDAKRIFLLGHSLGGMMAPRIGEADTALVGSDAALAGLIVMGGPARPLEDVLLEQFTYLLPPLGELNDEKKAKIELIKKQVEHVKDPNLHPDTPAFFLLGFPGKFWLSLRGDLPPTVASRLKQRLLILQGERDYNVTLEDFALWKKYLADRKNTEFKSYPRLNHLMMAGEGKAKPEEVTRAAGNVDAHVIEDIADWIKNAK